VPDPVVVESVEAFMRRVEQYQRLRCSRCGKVWLVPTALITPVPLALAASAGTAVTDLVRSRFLCRAFGVGHRQACARPFGAVRAVPALACACSQTSPPQFRAAMARMTLIARLHRHARRLPPATARVQSP